MLQPASFGGYGRQTGVYGGLKGVEFAARCPPDVQKGTRIVAVCGIPGAKAAPQDDGWFFSDFFLFYQMLAGRCECNSVSCSTLYIDIDSSIAELPNQLWLSSCSPGDLIRKHERYLHGPANGIAGDRRVVMNGSILPKDEIGAGFRVFQEKDLLERFLVTLKSEIKEARRSNQPVLVLIFGHGEEKSSGIFIGCDEGGYLKLNQTRLASVLDKRVQTTMILTSSFSGGWIMKPNFNKDFDVAPTFNHSFLTAAGLENPSLSWSLSQTVGRQAGGSIFATCLLNSIVTASDRTQGIYSGERVNSDDLDDTGKLVKVREDNDGEQIALSMAALTQQIVFECEARYGNLWEIHNFSFAAQDDLWANACGERTGLPLLNYKERWESLPKAQLSRVVYPTTGPLAGSVMSRSPTALHNLVRVNAVEYMNSKPGLDNSGCNTDCHPGFYKLIEGKEVDFDELYRLNNILNYRLCQLGLAEYYCSLLVIANPEEPIRQFDETVWEHSQLEAKRGRSPERSKDAIELLDRFYTIRGWIGRLDIFDPPRPEQGLSYLKPKHYLSVRLAQSSMSMQQIDQKLEDLSQRMYFCKLVVLMFSNFSVDKLLQGKDATQSSLGTDILNKPEVKTLRGRLYNTVSRLRYRLRSLSPHKRSPRRGVDA
jgi:hypothetical protein